MDAESQDTLLIPGLFEPPIDRSEDPPPFLNLDGDDRPPSSDRPYWLAWSQLPRVGSVLIHRLYQHFGTLEAAWGAPGAALQEVEGVGGMTLEMIQQQRDRRDPLELLAQHQEKNPLFWTPADPDYPHLLREIPNPPPVLYGRGTGSALDQRAWQATVAIVGTRDPSDYGRRWTRYLSQALVEHGFTIISGMAAGIDAEAHQACLQAGGATLGIVGTGVDVVYPARNRGIYDEILRTGYVLSEYPAQTKPDKAHFPQRNRIIAGLCRAVLVMEAGTRSGALITARWGNDLGREVYALPHHLDNPKGIGCLRLVSQGAHVILGAEELLKDLGTLPHLDQPNPSALQPIPPDLPPDLTQVIQILSLDPLPLDLIIQQTGLATAMVSSALLQLELMGLVVQVPGMRYHRC